MTELNLLVLSYIIEFITITTRKIKYVAKLAVIRNKFQEKDTRINIFTVSIKAVIIVLYFGDFMKSSLG